MPDWSYRTLFRPCLFRLPFDTARDLCLGFLGHLARLPLGGAVIDFLGHMRPDARLETNVAGLWLASPVVVGPYLDRHLVATGALARFGVGMIEIGPLGRETDVPVGAVRRRDDGQSLVFESLQAARRLNEVGGRVKACSVPILARLATPLDNDGRPDTCCCEEYIAELRGVAAAIGVELSAELLAGCAPEVWQEHVRRVVQACAAANSDDSITPALPVLICLPADARSEIAAAYLEAAIGAGAAGVVVDGRIREESGAWLVGRLALDASLGTVKTLRERVGKMISIIAGGANDPRSALELAAAGASAVQIDAAIVYAGPGLAKRMNEAILFARQGAPDRPAAAVRRSPDAAASALRPEHAAAMSWFWAMLLGVAMVIGGLLALGFASTSVLLPYDEAYLGMTAEELASRVPRLLEFMAHDRVTLAGTMLAIGIQYVFLAWWGIRRGEHWAKVAVVTSAFAGFLSFFLFLGFGYFDPLHAFVTAILFQFLLLAFQGRLGQLRLTECPNLVSDWRWRLANWGQLLLVAQGIAVFTAGLTIASVGITTVFVHEDLEFMNTTVENIRSVNPRLVPVVAHDRASFGGMLISVGLATLLPALWGIRQGARWLWWMLAIAGTVGYGATLIVHLHVGYTDPMHLAPALGGLAMLWLALALLYPYLAARNPAHQLAWKKVLSRGALTL